MARYCGWEKPMDPMGVEACSHGTKWEDYIRIYHEKRIGEKIEEFSLVKHPVHAWLGGSPDGISVESGILCEYKAPLRRKLIQGEVPPHYHAQIQILLEIFGLEECHYIELKPADVFNTEKDEVNFVVVKRDRAWFAEQLPKLKAFWERVQLLRHQGAKAWIEELVPEKDQREAAMYMLDKRRREDNELWQFYCDLGHGGSRPTRKRKTADVTVSCLDLSIGVEDPTAVAVAMMSDDE